MGNYRPGRVEDTLEERCLKDAVRKIVQALGDDVLIKGDVCRVIYKSAFEKLELEDELSVADEWHRIYWPTCDPLHLCSGDEVIRKDVRYEVFEQPRDLKNGYTCAKLDYCGNC